MIREVCRFCKGLQPRTLNVNPTTKEVITVLADEFGHMHIVQTPILNKNVNHAENVAAAKAMLASHEDNFVAELKQQFKYAATQIDSLKKSLPNCDCK